MNLINKLKEKRKKVEEIMSSSNKEGRRIFILRHAERVDFIAPDWISICFDNDGNYIRRDLNMPKTIPKRYVM